MGRQLEELSALKGGWNVIFLLPDSLMFDIAQILYKEGMKCTQEKARDRPKMKEVVGHIIRARPFPSQVYEELLRCESHSPTPYELQIKFDSTEKNPFVAQAHGPGEAQRKGRPLEQPQQQQQHGQHLPSEALPTVLPSVSISTLPNATPQNEEEVLIPDFNLLEKSQGEEAKTGENYNYSEDFTSDSMTNSNSTYNSDSTYQDSTQQTADKIEQTIGDIKDLDPFA